jgi:hypothetical protein
VREKINERVGRYLFFMLLFSAGMWNASAGMLSGPSELLRFTTWYLLQRFFLRHLRCILQHWRSPMLWNQLAPKITAEQFWQH